MESLGDFQEGTTLEEQCRRGEAHVRHVQDPEQRVEVFAEAPLGLDVDGHVEVQLPSRRRQRPVTDERTEVVELPQPGCLVRIVRRIGHGRNGAILAADPEPAVDLERADGRNCTDASNGHPPTDTRDRSIMLQISRLEEQICDLDPR